MTNQWMGKWALAMTALSGGLLTSGLLSSASAWAADVIEEIPVESALAPARGYDDNDKIQLVLHGYLPNNCYSLGEYKIEANADKKLRVRQYAVRSTEGVCAQSAELPPHMKMLVPFTTEVSIGQLPAGDYEFDFMTPAGKVGARTMNVARALAPTIDSLPYAAVSQATALDVLTAQDEIETTLTGVLNSTCTEIDPNVRVEKINDVFVVLPTIKVKHGVFCAQVMIPFQVKLNLGKATPGHYLIHVRSMNGKAVNHVVDVVQQ